ncbi:MAG TPA: hypothetical protein VGE97_06870 [Nitrososphaera sp.]
MLSVSTPATPPRQPASTLHKGEKQQNLMLSPASSKWRSAYYACGICRNDADFISPKGLIPICSDCKARYIGIFGYEAFEMNMQETKTKEKKNWSPHYREKNK